jgi:hypothetical protein
LFNARAQAGHIREEKANCRFVRPLFYAYENILQRRHFAWSSIIWSVSPWPAGSVKELEADQQRSREMSTRMESLFQENDQVNALSLFNFKGMGS